MTQFTQFFSRNKLILISFIISSCLAYGAFFYFYPLSPSQDWDYFNALSLFIRSSYRYFHRFPLQNPWLCGGLDLLTNPQNRLFSPMGILDWLLPPYLANLLSLMIFSLVGHLGMYLCSRHLGISKLASLVISILFIQSNWFGHHFAVGHITFGSMQLLPLSMYLAFKSKSDKYFLFLALLHSFFLLDGAFYTFVFSVYLIGTATLLKIGGLSLGHWREKLNHNPKFVFCCILASAFIASPKIIPLFVGLGGHAGELEDANVSAFEMVKSLFWPLTNFETPQTTPHQFHFHEVGAYFGLLNCGLLLVACISLRKRTVSFLLGMGFWLWVASGWGSPFNPWSLHQLSTFGSLHVQTRLLLLFQIYALFLVGFGLDALLKRSVFWSRFLIILLFFEGTFVRNYPEFYSFKANASNPPTELIQSQNLLVTLNWSQGATHFSLLDTGSRFCYEPSHTVPTANYFLSPKYRGEIYPLVQQKGTARLVSYIPGRVTVDYEGLTPLSVLEVNTNHLWGWVTNNKEVNVTSQPGGLLNFQVANSTGQVTFQYQPFYLVYIYIGISLGVLLLFMAFRFISGKKQSGFNYDSFPSGYYHDVLERGHPVRKAWHLQKFERIISLLAPTESILDIGCFSGTFLSLIPNTSAHRQVGVDILKNQINFAKEHFENEFRTFYFIENIADIESTIQEKFDVITIIEVIEHLEVADIAKIITSAHRLLKKGGRLIITTPNYSSAWPAVEFLINLFSEVNYEEQHITHFSFFNIQKKLKRIIPGFDGFFDLDVRTTTHFISPFLAAFSFDFAQRLSQSIDHFRWRFPFGNLILISFRKK